VENREALEVIRCGVELFPDLRSYLASVDSSATAVGSWAAQILGLDRLDAIDVFEAWRVGEIPLFDRQDCVLFGDAIVGALEVLRERRSSMDRVPVRSLSDQYQEILSRREKPVREYNAKAAEAYRRFMMRYLADLAYQE
jgi:hypothetical protein